MADGTPLRVERVAVLGDGETGAGIAQSLAVAGYRVTLAGDADALTLARAEVDGGRHGLMAACDAGRISSAERRAALERLSLSEDRAGALAGADLAVVSHEGPLEATAALLASVEAAMGEDALLACNSPGEPVGLLAAGLLRPERLVGWRWGRPAPISGLAAIVRGPRTSAGAAATVAEAARRAGKNPVVIADAPDAWGYVTNRLWAALEAEASRITGEGVATEAQVDELMVDCYRWPSGPFGRGPRPH